MTTSTIGLFVRHLALSEEAKLLKDSSDRDLLAAYQAERSEAAFTELMRRYEALVLRTCRRVLGQGPDAEDVFQVTFILLARKAGQLARRTAGSLTLGGWLHRVAYQTALNARIGMARRKAREQQANIMAMRPSSCSDPTVEATWNELQPILDEELDALPEEARRLLIACYLHGKSYTEAAAELGLPRSSLAWRLGRARELLAARLARRGVTVSAALLAVLLEETAKGAGVSAVLRVYTLRAAMTFHGQAAGMVSAHVASLMKGALTSMTKSSTYFGILLAGWVGLLGIGLLACQTLRAWPDQTPESEPATAKRPAREKDKPARADCHGDPLPTGALARLGTMRWRLNEYSNECSQLSFTPDGKGLITVGGDNLPRLWDVATGKLWREFRSLDFQVHIAALSPDGRILAVRGRMDSVHLLETTTGKRLREFKGAKAKLEDNRPFLKNFAFSPDSKAIALQLDGGLELRDAATGRPVWRKNEQDVTALAFSPDGKTLALADGEEGVRLWDARTGEALRTLGHKRRIDHVVFSPDGRTLAVGYEMSKDRHRSVHLWDVATGKEVRQLGEADEHLGFPAFSPDGKIVATRGVEAICLWETASGKELRRCQHTHPHGNNVPRDPAAFTPDGKVFAALDGPLVRFWDAASGNALPSQLPKGHESGVNSVAFRPDGQTLISAAGEGTVRWWDTSTGQERLSLSCTKAFPESGSFPKAVLSPDGTVLAVVGTTASEGEDHGKKTVPGEVRRSICFRDAATGKELRRLDCGKGSPYVFEVAFSPDGKVLAESFCAKNGNTCVVRLWDVASGKPREHELPGSCPVFSPDGRILVTLEMGNMGTTMHFWEMATGKKARSLEISEKRYWRLAFSPDGKTLAAASFVEIALYSLSWDKPSGVQVGASCFLDCPSHGHVTAWAFSPDGRMLATSGGDHTIHLWETATGRERTRFQGHSRTARPGAFDVMSLCFSAEGRRLASGSRDSTILLWDVTGRLQDGELRPAKLSDKELADLWTNLASSDAGRAGRAVWKLAAAGPPTVSCLQAWLRPVTARATPEAVAQLIADLDAEDFLLRKKARRELEKLGESCESMLRQALAKQPSAETQRSLQQLLSPLEEARKKPSGEVLRGIRAVEVLEQIGTPPARQMLKTLATGLPQARLTHEAQAALARLEQAGRK